MDLHSNSARTPSQPPDGSPVTKPITDQTAALPQVRYGQGALTFGEQAHIKWIENCLRSLPAGARLLDAGAGPRRYRHLCQHLAYVSQDFGQYDGRGNAQGEQNGTWDTSRVDIVSDICAIPEPDASFNGILCASVLEHLPNPQLALKEFARLLQPGGRLFVTAPFAGITHQAPFHFFTGFTRYFYEEHLKADFEILEITASGGPFEFLSTYFHYLLSLAPRYTSAPGPDERENHSIDVITAMLERYAKESKDSADILNFGYQVTAVRR